MIGLDSVHAPNAFGMHPRRVSRRARFSSRRARFSSRRVRQVRFRFISLVDYFILFDPDSRGAIDEYDAREQGRVAIGYYVHASVDQE